MNQKGNVASAIGSILLGILLIIMKGKIITVAITILAVFVNYCNGTVADFRNQKDDACESDGGRTLSGVF